MALNEPMSRAVQTLSQLVSEEHDTEQLRDLVLEMNALLNDIERQLARLEGRDPRSH